MLERSRMSDSPEMDTPAEEEISDINESVLRQSTEILATTTRQSPQIDDLTETQEDNIRQSPEMNEPKSESPEIKQTTQESPEINIMSMFESLAVNALTTIGNPGTNVEVKGEHPSMPKKIKRSEFTPSECSDFSDEFPIPPQRSKKKDRVSQFLWNAFEKN